MTEQPNIFDEQVIKGGQIGYHQLLKFQMYWINKSMAIDVKRQIINLVFGLETMLVPYLDDDYNINKENLLKEFKGNKVGLNDQVFIAKSKYRLLVALMDRCGLLLEKSMVDEI